MRPAEAGATLYEKKTVVTGASGNLGSKLARALIRKGYTIVLIDQIPHPNLPVQTADLSSPGKWMDLFAGADFVVQFFKAAHGAGDRDDVCAFRCQRLRGLIADAARCTRDHGEPSIQRSLTGSLIGAHPVSARRLSWRISAVALRSVSWVG